GREPPANPALVQLHVLFRPERGEHSRALLCCQAPKIKLVVIAKELAPLPRCRPGFGFFHRLGQGCAVAARKRIEEMLVYLEVAQSSVARVYAVIIGYIVAVIAARRRLKGHQPECGHPDAL